LISPVFQKENSGELKLPEKAAYLVVSDGAVKLHIPSI